MGNDSSFIVNPEFWENAEKWHVCCTFKLPAISSTLHNKISRQHLIIFHKVREAFIMNENSEKVH